MKSTFNLQSCSSRNCRFLYDFILLFCLFSFVLGCKKDMEFKEPKKELYTVVEGKLQFSSMANFRNFIQHLQKFSTHDAANQISQIDGFTSLALKQPIFLRFQRNSTPINGHLNSREKSSSIQIDPIDGLPIDYPSIDDEFIEDLIMDPYLRMVLNPSREIMIEELVLRVTEFGTLIYEFDKSSRVDFLESISTNFLNFVDESQFSDFEFRVANIEDDIAIMLPPRNFSDGMMSMSIGPDELCRKCPLVNSYLEYPTKVCFQQRTWNIFGEKTVCSIDYAHRRRARGVVWSQNLVFYCSIGIETRNQSRVMGIWWAKKADKVSVSAIGEYTMEVNAVGGPNILSILPYSFTEPPIFNHHSVGKVLNSQFGNISISIPLGNGKIKSKPFKALVKFKLKKHESDHVVEAMSTFNHMKIKFN